MQNVPAGWDEVRSGLYRMETRATIAGTEYGEADITALHIEAALFAENTVSIGGCVAKEISMTVTPKGEIPRMAEIRVFVRPISDGVETAWLPKGVFYIDTREEDYSNGLLTIHGYDAMLKAEQTYLEEGDTGEWPRTMKTVVEDIAARLGVSVDSRTVLNEAYTVEYPGDYTMREILRWIASANAGNWIMTDTGELRLVSLVSAPAETYFLCDDDGAVLLFGDTKIIVE